MNRLERALEAHDLSRRDFLKGCAALATAMGLGSSFAPNIARALAQAAERPPVVWVTWQECLGCTESVTKSRDPDFVSLVLDLVSVEYHEAIMAGAGEAAHESLQKNVSAGGYVLVVEGSVATGIENAMTVGGRTSVDIAREVIPPAALVIAIGNCAAFGNVQAAYPNPTGAMGMQEFMENEGMDTDKLVQLTTCPVNPVHLTSTITYFLTRGALPETDHWRRPLVHFGKKVHDMCERRAHFDEGRFVEQLGSEDEFNRYCLYKMGCRGPSTFADCPQVLYNGRTSWCVQAGQCIGCAEKDFWDELIDFYQPMPGIAIPGVGGSARTPIPSASGWPPLLVPPSPRISPSAPPGDASVRPKRWSRKRRRSRCRRSSLTRSPASRATST